MNAVLMPLLFSGPVLANFEPVQHLNRFSALHIANIEKNYLYAFDYLETSKSLVWIWVMLLVAKIFLFQEFWTKQ